MFALAFAIGIFSYIVFSLGMVGLLYKPLLVGLSLIYWLGFLVFMARPIGNSFKKIQIRNWSFPVLLCILYLVLQSVVNSIGLLGPEIGFDATWYHLTLPKLYLLYHFVVHIPGGILYYSDMPKLTEMLYTAGLAFGSDIWARGIQFVFGLFSCFAIYKIGRRYFSREWAILLPVIFLSNLVVGWESISAYIDLSRTFFAVMTLWAFLNWMDGKEKNWLIISGLMLGFTITTKLLSFGDIALYGGAIMLFLRKEFLRLRWQYLGIFVLLALIVPLPWLAFSFIHTGNPFYPIFSGYKMPDDTFAIFNPLFLITTLWETFAMASDPIHPIFLGVVPFLIVTWRKISQEYPLILYLTLGSLLLWYVTPQTGGGRYILPYLPLFSLLALLVIKQLSSAWQRLFVLFISLIAIISLGYRLSANAKFLPVITHKESQAHFMAKHLQFYLGDFYDIDGYFATHIKPTDKVLLYGFHNLYYVDFPFIDNSWAQKGDTFDYVAVQGNGMPPRFSYWNLIYYNNTTKVSLYSFKGQTWYY